MSSGKKQIECRPCDFKEPLRLPEEKVRLGHVIFDSFARYLEHTLIEMWTGKAKIKLRYHFQQSMNRFITGLPPDSLFTTFTHQASGKQALLAFEAPPLFNAISQMVGSKWTPPRISPTISVFEQSLIRKFHQILFQSLAQAISPTTEFTIDTLAGKPAITGDGCFIASLFIQCGDTSGSFAFAVPFDTIRVWFNETDKQPYHKPEEPKRVNIQDARLTLRAILGSIQLERTEVNSLQVGDVVPLNTTRMDPVSVVNCDQTILYGRPGYSGQNKAIVIESLEV